MASKETTSFIPSLVGEHVELSSLDHFLKTFACIPWTMFYKHDISGAKLKSALEKIAASYPVLCGRLKAHPEKRLEIEVKKDVGFSFTETSSDMTLLEAISQARVSEQPAQFPSFAALPFFAAQMVTPALINQDAPIFMVKLVHFKDGCCLSTTIHHTVADGTRFADLLVDIATAYRGDAIRKVDHDRTQGWADVLISKVQVDEDPKDFPRVIPTPFDNLPLPHYEGETYAVESIYFPSDEVEKLKAQIKPKLQGIEYVTTVDILSALLWMMHAEFEVRREGDVSKVETAGDLNIFETFFLYFVDFASDDSPLFSKNYFGNAYIGSLVSVPPAANDQAKSIGLLDTLVMVSTLIHKFAEILKIPQAQVKAAAAEYKYLQELPPYPNVLAGGSSFFKMPFSKMNFGHGAPVYNYALPSYPFAHVWGGICPLTNNNGAVVQKVVRSVDKKTLLASNVFQTLIPGFKILSELSNDQTANLVGL